MIRVLVVVDVMPAAFVCDSLFPCRSNTNISVNVIFLFAMITMVAMVAMIAMVQLVESHVNMALAFMTIFAVTMKFCGSNVNMVIFVTFAVAMAVGMGIGNARIT